MWSSFTTFLETSVWCCMHAHSVSLHCSTFSAFGTKLQSTSREILHIKQHFLRSSSKQQHQQRIHSSISPCMCVKISESDPPVHHFFFFCVLHATSSTCRFIYLFIYLFQIYLFIIRSSKEYRRVYS